MEERKLLFFVVVVREYVVLVSEFSLVSLDTSLLETMSAFTTHFITAHFSVDLSKRLNCWFKQVPPDFLKLIFKKNAARSLQKTVLCTKFLRLQQTVQKQSTKSLKNFTKNNNSNQNDTWCCNIVVDSFLLCRMF